MYVPLMWAVENAPTSELLRIKLRSTWIIYVFTQDYIWVQSRYTNSLDYNLRPLASAVANWMTANLHVSCHVTKLFPAIIVQRLWLARSKPANQWQNIRNTLSIINLASIISETLFKIMTFGHPIKCNSRCTLNQ